MAITDYGIQLKRGNGATPEVFTAIASVVNMPGPELINAAVQSTTHDSGGYRAFISGALKELAEFAITINYTPATPQYGATSGLIYDLINGTVRNYQVVFPDTTTWSFAALVTNFAPAEADSASPNPLTAVVTFRPTGVPTLV